MPGQILIGNQYSFLRHIITLESIGRVTVLVGRGICLGVGTATRGPAMTPFFISGSQPSRIRSMLYAGPLCDALTTASDQGPSVVGGIRVLGDGYTTASLELDDLSSEAVGTLTAAGPGVWGEIPRIQVAYGDINHRKTETPWTGNGGTTAYALTFDDIVEAATNYVKVDGTSLTIVYTGTPGAGEAKIDKTAGELSFHTGEWPDATQLIECRYSYKTRKLTIRDEVGQPHVYNNVKTLTELQARMRYDDICTFEPEVGATHLPMRTLDISQELTYVNMAGGSDGAAITIDDWELAFNTLFEDPRLGSEILPTSVFVTENTVDNEYDVVGLMDAFLIKMANGKGPVGKMPCQGFVSLVDSGQDIPTDLEMAEIAEGYNNLWMTLIANGLSATERNLAAARAGQEASLPLGVSPARPENSLRGVNNLLFQIDDVQTDIFTYGQVEVLIKETGIHPYVGISTNPDDNFKRTVDVRTIAECIILIDQCIKQFLNERRTQTNLNRMQSFIEMMLGRLRDHSILDDFSVAVTPNETDRNAVDVSVMIQPVGHIERVYTWLGVGYYSDRLAE
jgi:hypothetical protein